MTRTEAEAPGQSLEDAEGKFREALFPPPASSPSQARHPPPARARGGREESRAFKEPESVGPS